MASPILDMLAGQMMQGMENPLAPRTARGSPGFAAPILQPHPYEYAMQTMIDHHNENVLKGGTTMNPNGDMSSIKTMMFGGNGEPYVIFPSIWNGKDLSAQPDKVIQLALEKQRKTGRQWPTFNTQAEADAADALLHQRWK